MMLKRLTDRSRDERGAVAIMSAVSLVFLISATALSVDVGSLVASDRNLEKVVDLAALDTARALENAVNSPSGIPGGADPETYLTEKAAQSAVRNGFNATDADAGNELGVEVGLSDPATKSFAPLDFALWRAANAVRISGATVRDHNFAPGDTNLSAIGVARITPRTSSTTCPIAPCAPPSPESGGGGGGPTGTGNCVPGDSSCPDITRADPWAAISVGSALGSFSTRDSFMDPFLGAMLGTAVDIDGVGYTGLSDASVELGMLWSRLGIDAGSAEEVLHAEVSARDLLTAMVDALNAQGDPSSVAAATAIGAFATSVSTPNSVTFGQLVDFGMGQPGAAATASFNVLDLLTGVAQVANGQNLLGFDLPFAIPGVSRARMTVAFIEPARRAAGPPGMDANGNYITVARTAQARVFLEVELSNTLNVGGVAVPVRMPLYIESGGARSALHSVTCDVVKDNTVTGVATATEVATVRFADVDSSTLLGGAVTPAPGVVSAAAGLVRITGQGSMAVSGTNEESSFTGAHQDASGRYLRVDRVGSTSVSLASLRNQVSLEVSSSNPLLGPLLATDVRALLSPVYDAVQTHVLTPLSQTPLGIMLGTADVTNTDTECTYTASGGE